MAEDEKILIARFLRANNYEETLNSFLSEAGLPPDAGTTTKGGFTLEKLLQEKKAFDISASFEKLATSETTGWRYPTPSSSTSVGLPTTSNILSTAVLSRQLDDGSRKHLLWSSAANKCITISDAATLVNLACHDTEAPVLSIAQCSRYVVYGDMAGNLTLAESHRSTILDKRKDHRKYVVRIATYEAPRGTWVATAGWDATVYVYWIPLDAEIPALSAPVGKVTLVSNPEAALFVTPAESTQPFLMISQRDSTFLYYYQLPDVSRDPETPSIHDMKLLGRQNLAPHALSWVAFTPADIALCPTDPTIVAAATSSTPHMRVLIVRLLPPAQDSANATQAWALEPPDATPERDLSAVDVTSRARAELALQDREEAAILISCNAMAPQTQYSTPVVVWRPDGSGVWVSGDDGVVRGIETSSGKVMAKLEGHEPGSKIRCLWAGMVGSGEESEEWLVSGGFDQRLLVWNRAR